MFGIGFTELLVIAIVALLFVGPKRLPEVMKQAGRFFVQMRRTANDVRHTFDGVVRQAENEMREEEARVRQTLIAETSSAGAAAQPSRDPQTPPHADPHAPEGAQPASTSAQPAPGAPTLPVEGFGVNRPGSSS
jgi:sec-independent protein translocase protein TatB